MWTSIELESAAHNSCLFLSSILKMVRMVEFSAILDEMETNIFIRLCHIYNDNEEEPGVYGNKLLS